MNKAKQLLFISLLITSFLLLPLSSAPAHASVLGDIVNGVKNSVQNGIEKIKDILSIESKEFVVDSKIELAPNGDINKNNELDSGDYARFSYVIKNQTENSFSFARINTNVKTNSINSITNVKGILSLESMKDTIVIPNISLTPYQLLSISFDARVNFSKDTDLPISTEVEFFDEKDRSIFKDIKKEVSAKKLNSEQFNKFTHKDK